MFTGIIEEVGQISAIDKLEDLFQITVKTDSILNESKVGDSISINGVCLTLTSIRSNSFTSDVVRETIERTNLKYIKVGNYINLERAMRANSRFDGHIVQGHVEGMGKVKRIQKDENFIIKVQLPEKLANYCIYKGSITINGTSLTIASIKENLIDIWIIPHTLSRTTFDVIKENDYVNIETDIIAKYIEKFNKGK